jgi:hypothetical protein
MEMHPSISREISRQVCLPWHTTYCDSRSHMGRVQSLGSVLYCDSLNPLVPEANDSFCAYLESAVQARNGSLWVSEQGNLDCTP